MQNLRSLSIQKLKQKISDMGEPSFRASQIMKWLYQKRVENFAGMKNMPKTLRGKLASEFHVDKLRVVKMLESENRDAVKFAVSSENGDGVFECVLLIDGKRRTACVSSQLGCALGCTFCATAGLGFVRNLDLSEIAGQVIVINDYLASESERMVTNVVFMGMGEALSNFEAFRDAVEILMDGNGFYLGRGRITVSTAGVVPSIKKLMESGLNLKLAVSLNTYNDKERSRIMPVNRKYPVDELIRVSKEYRRVTGIPVTFEYVVMEGENDTDEAADVLGKMLGSFDCKVNLIPLNRIENSKRKACVRECAVLFAEKLHGRGIMVMIRKSRGADISGACGQLAGKRKLKVKGENSVDV